MREMRWKKVRHLKRALKSMNNCSYHRRDAKATVPLLWDEAA